MATSPDELEQRIRFVTRSGRSVRPPTRYEPDPDQIFEDDFSDAFSDLGSGEDEWGHGMESQTEDEDLHEPTDSEEVDFTDTESRDSSYESSASDTMSSDEEDDTDTDREEDETEEEEEVPEFEDLLEWDTLTVDASDPDSSEDDQDL